MVNNKFLILVLSLICIHYFSCKENNYGISEDKIKLSIGADQLSITRIEDTILMSIHYTTPPLTGFDFKSSSAALQFIDTSLVSLRNDGILFTKVLVHSNQQIIEYTYPLSELETNKIGMDIGAQFLQNFLSGTSEQNARYVDLDKVSLEDLYNLNQISEQIQSQVKIENVTYDGFSSHKSEPHNIEFRGNLQGQTEVFPFVFQYDKTKSRIFYFGINE
jgi:hypothetical protein